MKSPTRSFRFWPSRGDNAAAFANSENLIGLDLRESLDLLRSWPLHFDCIHGLSLSQTKVKAQVALRHDASTAADFIHLDMFSRDNSHPRSNGRAITLAAHKFYLDPILFVASIIA